MPRRPLAWADTLIQQALVPATQVNSDLLNDLAAADTITSVRIVGRLMLYSDNVLSVVDSAMRLDLGIQVIPARTLTVGGAAIPNPSVSSEGPARGWLYRDRIVYVQSIASGPIDWHRVPEVQFDLGAMRKVDRGNLILSMTTNVDLGTAINCRLVGIVRVLCMT